MSLYGLGPSLRDTFWHLRGIACSSRREGGDITTWCHNFDELCALSAQWRTSRTVV